MKPQPWGVMPPRISEPKWPYGFKYYPGSNSDGEPFPMNCPYGQPGDRLWVRETWSIGVEWDETKPRSITRYSPDSADAMRSQILYRADRRPTLGNSLGAGKVRPSIHMPRWASRITLEIASVRVERVQDITKEDALAEGIEASRFTIAGFVMLWDKINAKRGFHAETNPWVWVVEFKVVKP